MKFNLGLVVMRAAKDIAISTRVVVTKSINFKTKQMKRNQFMLTAATVALSPLAVFAKQKVGRSNEPGKGFKANAGEGRIHGHIKLKGVNANLLDLKVSGSDNGGSMAIFEQTSISPGKGTPLHVHHSQDEVFYVVEGSYYFKVGEQKFHVSAGDTVFLPMKVPHAWTQVSERGKMTVTFQPAGKMENFFTTLAATENIPTPAEMAKLFADHEMEIVGPPLVVE